MAVRNILTTLALCVFSATLTDALDPTCIDACRAPTTVTSFVTTQLPSASCYNTQLPVITTTCTKNITTITRTASVIVDCSPLPSTTVPYTRCPTATTALVTTAAPCPQTTSLTVTECPGATRTVTVTSRYTLPNVCYPTKKTITFTATPTGTDTLPACSVTVTTTSIASPTPTFAGVWKWGQCGGLTWTGPTRCVEGTTCVVINPYFSNCL